VVSEGQTQAKIEGKKFEEILCVVSRFPLSFSSLLFPWFDPFTIFYLLQDLFHVKGRMVLRLHPVLTE
jgi:hypothetical protein